MSKEASVARARASGCDVVFVWGSGDLAAEVANVTSGKKADVVYDPIGRNTFEASLNSLRPRGLLVSFGASSGSIPPLQVDTLNAKGSLFLTRPSLAAHNTDLAEYRTRAEDVLSAVAAGIIKPSIWKSFALAEVADAHTAMERGASSGAVVLRP